MSAAAPVNVMIGTVLARTEAEESQSVTSASGGFFAVLFAYSGGPFVLAWNLIFFANVFLLIRLGFLALMAQGVFGFCLLNGFPLTNQGSAWYAGIGMAGILLMAAMALYGFYTSLGGRPVFRGAVFED